MRDRLLLAGLICCAPLALGWLVYRNVQWSRWKRWHGTYEQPIEPRPVVDLDDEYLWAEQSPRTPKRPDIERVRNPNPDTIH